MSRSTATGGREATTAVIPGNGVLSIGNPRTFTTVGYEWTPLSAVARLESGHTPSRGRDDYWNGGIPWVGIKDATSHHGEIIGDTFQQVSQLGVENSSTRLLPAGTVCLSRTASVGYVVQMAIPMCTSQDFVNWVCGTELNPNYLRYALMVESDSIRRWATGSTHQTLYYPEAKAINLLMPSRHTQDAVAEVVGALDDKIAANRRTASTINELLGAIFDYQFASSRTTELGTIADINRVAVKPRPAGELRYLDIAAVRDGDHEIPCTTDWNTAPSRARRGLARGDVVWSTVRPNRRSHSLILDNDPLLVASTGLAVISPRECGPAFLYEAARQPAFQQYLESVAEGSAYPAVRAEAFTHAPVPDVAALSRDEFENVANPLRQLQASLRRENLKLATTRDELLPLLMNGKVNVKQAAAKAEEML
ncbi:restriction endonuclease subunit S [Mycobacterium sp. SMC-16]|uniref:restriction endonuclease subunit S n=1 Tax=Mycobacteriaceae TaxID=1762 RepID=UPI001CFB001E|nr:restriction endonuclease subunit S [Mycolicibacterium phocaicum]UCZ60141.1 restriction endonuclease subunit S [Mycolicibacterium phocaicum]